MKTQSISKYCAALFAAVLVVASSAPTAQAQNSGTVGQVNVPFAFETVHQHFAPGVYTIRLETPNLVAIEGASSSGFLLTQAGGNLQSATKSKVVFRKYGDQYFLGEIWIAQKTGHLNLIKSSAEKKLQHPRSNTEPAGVALAMLETTR
jgi:hypothetical protein